MTPIAAYDHFMNGGHTDDDRLDVKPRIVVGSRTQAGDLLNSKTRGSTVKNVISIGEPNSTRKPYGLHNSRRDVLRLEFFDIPFPCAKPDAPTPEHAAKIIQWGQKAVRKEGIILCHCQAGISRSTAAAFILNVLELGFDEESIQTAAHRLEFVRPEAWPNYQIIRFADEQLGLDGMMLKALDPFFHRDPRISHYLKEING